MHHPTDRIAHTIVFVAPVVEQWLCHKRQKFLTHPCRRQLLKIFFISNNLGRSLCEAFDWLFICVDPSDVYDLRVKVVVEIETP